MLLGDFLNDYNKRKNEKAAFRKICQENGISYKKLPELLRSFHYEYDQTKKEWYYTQYDELAQPLDIDLNEMIPARTSPKAAQQTRSTDTMSEARQQIASTEEVPQPHSITNAQLFDIVLLLQQINRKIPDPTKNPQPLFDPIESDPDAAPLALQLHRINQNTKTRKTFHMSQDAAAWLDAFAETKGHYRGDIISLAVIQLQKRIDPAHKAKG